MGNASYNLSFSEIAEVAPPRKVDTKTLDEFGPISGGVRIEKEELILWTKYTNYSIQCVFYEIWDQTFNKFEKKLHLFRKLCQISGRE